MSESLEPIFDAHLHTHSLSDRDLDTLRYFGTERAVVVAHHGFADRSAKGLRAHFDDILERQLPRLERAGIRAFAALGVHPHALPRRGLAEVLAVLPEYFQSAKVVALGEIGVSTLESEQEVEAFVEQLAIARRLKKPVVVHTPTGDKEKLTRKMIALLRDSKMPPGRVLLDHVSGRTVKLVLECGHYAGVSVHPDALRPELAVKLVNRLGSERLVLNSDAGNGVSDVTATARTVHLLRKAKLSDDVVFKVVRRNAERFFRIRMA